MFHLKVASGSGIDDLGTEFERHIFDLISQDCDPGKINGFCEGAFDGFAMSLSFKPLMFLISSFPLRALFVRRE